MTDLPLPSAEQARRSPFADEQGLPTFQIAWDSTSLGLFKECPRKYYYQIILGWQPKHQSVHLKFGQLYHSGMEAYDHFCAELGKLNGGLTDDEHMEGIRRALRHVLILAAEYETCPACQGTGKGEGFPDSQLYCLACNGKKKRFVSGWRSEDPYKNMWTLVRSIVWYLDKYRNSPLRTVLLSNGKPAVELSFYFDAGDINGIAVGYCGHLDRVVENENEQGRKSVHDRKTTKGQLNARYWKSFTPHNQFSLYTAAASIHYDQPTWGLTVDAAQVLVNSSSFQRQFIPFPPAIINEWLAESQVWISLAYRFAEMNNWPRNDKSCGNYGGCPFQSVCSKSEGFRRQWLEADFKPFRWNPLTIRGDI